MERIPDVYLSHKCQTENNVKLPLSTETSKSNSKTIDIHSKLNTKSSNNKNSVNNTEQSESSGISNTIAEHSSNMGNTPLHKPSRSAGTLLKRQDVTFVRSMSTFPKMQKYRFVCRLVRREIQINMTDLIGTQQGPGVDFFVEDITDQCH